MTMPMKIHLAVRGFIEFCWVIPSLAKITLAPMCMTTFPVGPRPQFYQEMICVILTNHMIASAVVSLFAVNMMNTCFWWQWLAESLFSNKDVFPNAPLFVSPRVNTC
jgi:hypothetical protein